MSMGLFHWRYKCVWHSHNFAQNRILAHVNRIFSPNVWPHILRLDSTKLSFENEMEYDEIEIQCERNSNAIP